MELKALRSVAAGRKVAELAGTAEGKSGLMRGLAEALQHDPSLRLQLGALLRETLSDSKDLGFNT